MEALGLDIKLLVAQVVNFGLLFFILKKILYKPLIKIIDERNEKINNAISDSKKIEEKLIHIEEKEKELLAKARETASKEREDLIKIANSEKEKIIAAAKEAAMREVAKGVAQVRSLQEEAVREVSDKVVDEMLLKLEKKMAKKTSNENYPLIRELLK